MARHENLKIRSISGWVKHPRCEAKDSRGEQCWKGKGHEEHSFPQPPLSPAEALEAIQKAAKEGNVVLATEMEQEYGGFVIAWSSDSGFGEVAFWMNPDGTIEIDDECSSRESLAEILLGVLKSGKTLSEKREEETGGTLQ